MDTAAMSNEPTSPASSARLAPVKEGDVLASKYRVEKVLGIGGMGVVVAAEHIELSQKVALKFLLKQAASNDELVGRFLREARASVRLKGSHVAKTLDVGRLDDGAPYIVMEFLDGHDLHAEIRGRSAPLAIQDAASYVVQAAEGLAEAHSLGIVHRDLKPGNLFLTRGVDGWPLVKVLDFGISKTMDTSIGGDGLSLTKTEMLLGSPLYMSPEQMRSSKNVDERSDLWALGAIAFELLTGRVPFEADTILELCFKVAQEKPPSPREFRDDLPEELCLAVLKCLEKDPGNRFPNVGELARAFEPFALPRDRGSAERALDVLGTGKRPPMRSVPSIAAPALASSGSPSSPGVAVGSATPTPGPTPAPGVPQMTPSQVEPVAPAAWGTTQAQHAAKSRRGMFAIAGGVVVVAALAGVMVSRKGASDSGAANAGSAAPSANANASSNGSANANASSNGSANANPNVTPKDSAGAANGNTANAAAGNAANVNGANGSGVNGSGVNGNAGTGTASADAGAAAVPSAPPAVTTQPGAPDRGPKPARSGGAAAAPPGGKGTKPAASGAPGTTATSAPAGTVPTAEPGGFIKVRE
jgi:serine/threonine protein kinase